jgi:membrane-associated protein
MPDTGKDNLLMNNLVPLLINWLQQYGYPALWGGVFIASIGLPLPISLVFLAAGAFAALGDFNLIFLALIGITASACGDSLGYLLGRKWGSKIILWLQEQQRFRFISPQAMEKSHNYFTRRGGLAIFLSRFLFSGLGGSINLLAGAELYPYSRFLLYDLTGEFLGAIIPLSLGYIFGASWEAVGDILSTVSLAIFALCCTFYLAWKLISQLRRVRRTRSVNKETEKTEESNKETEEKQNSATFTVSQTYSKETDAYLQPSLDSLAGNYAKNGPEGLE